MCPACWALREKVVQPLRSYSTTRMQTAGLVLGLIALLPIPALQIGAVVLNIVAIVKAKEPLQRAVRWRPVVGLCCACGGLLIDAILLFAFVLVRGS